MQKATVGRVVHVVVDPKTNNGSDIAPALIVRVWGEPYEIEDGRGPRQTVNLRVLLDEKDTPWLTSWSLYQQRLTSDTGHAFWPPRD